ncbi:hypothetical protein PROPHIGD05-2_65 [Mycobacterium phage prophiGD05-2]|nr:hypothetical protein PROPHIGD05-2_65 [Mycobacterium phage prophiGD05-2]
MRAVGNLADSLSGGGGHWVTHVYCPQQLPQGGKICRTRLSFTRTR